MKNIFVVTDNRFIYEEFSKILTNKEVTPTYFCSPKSSKMFAKEIKDGDMRPITLKSEYEELSSGYELGFSCHSKQIFPADLVNACLCVNIHPGYNPYNRGWFPQVFSILNKKPSGVSIHVMDEAIDHGDIIVQEQVDIYSYDTSLSAYNRVIEAEIRLFNDHLDSILSASFPISKPSGEGNYNSIKDYNALREIDLDQQVTMKQAIDFLRAMTHPPYKNAYFIDDDGSKIFVGLDIEKEE